MYLIYVERGGTVTITMYVTLSYIDQLVTQGYESILYVRHLPYSTPNEFIPWS